MINYNVSNYIGNVPNFVNNLNKEEFIEEFIYSFEFTFESYQLKDNHDIKEIIENIYEKYKEESNEFIWYLLIAEITLTYFAMSIKAFYLIKSLSKLLVSYQKIGYNRFKERLISYHYALTNISGSAFNLRPSRYELFGVDIRDTNIIIQNFSEYYKEFKVVLDETLSFDDFQEREFDKLTKTKLYEKKDNANIQLLDGLVIYMNTSLMDLNLDVESSEIYSKYKETLMYYIGSFINDESKVNTITEDFFQIFKYTYNSKK